MRELAGRYRVGAAVGRGGSAMVHRGFDRTLRRHVAIKLFFPYGPYADEAADDVLREARTAAGLNHPNVARVYDYGEVSGEGERTPYLVMEFLEGETLADRLARTGALEWRRAAEICADTAAALAAAHEQDLVHRDVKPRNVMLTPDGTKVLDFGIAAAAGKDSVDTQGRLWGTPAHLAPEQLRGEPTFPAADVYGLGLLLFECLTGERAWPGQSLAEILAARHGRQTPRLPRIPGLPRELIRLYEACVADDPQQRPTAAAAAQTLRAAAEPLTVTIPAVRPLRSRRRAVLMAGVGVATVLLSILGLQLANGTATPGGHRADAAEGEPAPGAPAPAISSAPAPTATTPAPGPTDVVPITVTTTTPVSDYEPRQAKPRPASTRKHTPTPSPSATPSATPTGTADPTPSETPDDSPSPTPPDDDPTGPGPTPTDDDPTPPVTESPEAESVA
ncbi:serine/threonine-protein kinase [Actinoplanes sp. N902-109]|uniref:serine/threonine-protein kinase n=1 Tax=Actinoplanes sp. (strain N902-109) TaxID=649831 RepID=UPI0003295E4C|nr:serine/threonine-protein kinase [Actinoplanes sp. N902-109]AGL18994.1 serine/threonine protein kinase [Actinoplanes sp. N902-109]